MLKRTLILSAILITGAILRLFPFQNITKGNLSYNECLAIADASQPLKDILSQYFDFGLFNVTNKAFREHAVEAHILRNILLSNKLNADREYKNKVIVSQYSKAGVRRYSQWIGIDSGVSAIKEAQLDFINGRYDHSIAVLNKYLAESKSSKNLLNLIYTGLASNYIEKGIKNSRLRLRLYRQAKIFCLKAKELSGEKDPLNISICSGLGFLYLQEGNYAMSLRVLREGLSYDLIGFEKERLDIYINQGIAYFNSGNESEAEESFGKALTFSLNEKEKQDIYSSLRNLHMQRGFNYFNSGMKDESKKSLNKALLLYPTQKEKKGIYSALRNIYITRGFSYFNSGQEGEAEENLVKALSLRPTKKEKNDVCSALRSIYMKRGFMYLNLGDRDKMKSSFSKVLSLSPTRVERDYVKLWLKPLSFVPISPDQAPLRYIILHFFMFLGDSEFVVRLPSLIFGLAGILVVYLLGNLLFNYPTGILSSFLLVFSMWHMRYSVSASDYTLYAFLSSLNVYFFYRSFNKPSSLSLRMAFIAVSVLGLYSFYPIASVFLAEFVFLCIFASGKDRNKEFLSWVISFVAVTLLFFPVFDRFFHGFTWKQGFGDYRWGLSLKELFPTLASVFNGINSAMPVNFVIFASGLVFAFCFRKKHKEALLLVLVILIPVVLLLLCFFLKINLAERYLFFLYPFFVILCSYGIICLKNKFVVLFLSAIFNAAFILSFMPFFGFSMDKYIPQDYFRCDADFHSLREYLELNYRQSDSLVVINAAGVHALKYNLDAANSFKVERIPPGSCQRLKYSGKALKSVIGLDVFCDLKKDIEAIAKKYPRVWIVDLNMIHYSDHGGAIGKWLCREAKTKEFFTGMTVYLLENKRLQDWAER